MPITRRKRANPPDQPENTNNLADQPETSSELSPDQAASASATPVETERPVDSVPAPARPESTPTQPAPTSAPVPPTQPALPPSLALAISERAERNERAERAERGERSEYTPIEGGRRTARGELFRRPPQPPPVTPPTLAAAAPAPTLQPPSHEIKLPLGKEQGDSSGDPLHLAYNPSYTGSDGARSALLQHLANESKAGGRARCWNCGSLAIVYDRWSTRSKTFGEVGIAFCEICGVWSVM
jgi:hypothetical protein